MDQLSGVRSNLSEESISNLRKLSDFLMVNSEKIYNSSTFNISAFSVGNGEVIEFPIFADCGTVCCAVGFGPQAGIAANRDENWSEYLNNFFTNVQGQHIKEFDIGCTNWMRAFHWMFGAHWCHRDNTPYGAALRIKLFLDDPKSIPSELTYGFVDQEDFDEFYPFKDEVKEWISKMENKSNV